MSQYHHRDRIPLADPPVGPRERRRVDAVLQSGALADGEEVRHFEAEFADYCGVDHAVACANGTAALQAALVGLGVGQGDRVVTTPMSFAATANVVRLLGAVPLFADVDPETLNLDPAAVRDVVEALDGDVDAILPVHLYGLPAEMDDLRAVAERYDAALLEDCAQAHGARYGGAPVGSLGDAGAFSFYPTKNMTTGEGGMVVTDRADVAERARSFVNHGRDPEDGSVHREVGHNLRMTNVAAAMGRVQLERLPQFVDARRDNAAKLDSVLSDTRVATPPDPSHVRHAYHQYTVRTADRDGLREHLSDAGVDTGVYYPTPIHRQPAYDHRGVDAPVAERATDEVLSLPVHPKLTDRQVNVVGEVLASYVR